MIIGFLLDVSGSMAQPFEGSDDQRIKDINTSIELLIENIKLFFSKESNNELLSTLKIFSIGFGFIDFTKFLLGVKYKKTRSLLRSDNNNIIIKLKDVIYNWEAHKNYIEDVYYNMFGDSPLFECLSETLNIIKNYPYEEKIIFLISDGVPSDASIIDILNIAEQIKKNNSIILSCSLHKEDIIVYKKLYDKKDDNWSEGTCLMFDLASNISEFAQITTYLKEYNWVFNNESHLFTQANHSKHIYNFLDIVMGDLKHKKNNNKKIKLLEHISKAEFSLFFKEIDELGIEDFTISDLKKQFLNGNNFLDHYFSEKLIVYINNLDI
jgi:hypothetical protein